jgi:hypothetical protein
VRPVQRGRVRQGICADLGLAAAVIGVTGLALLLEKIMPRSYRGGIGMRAQGIDGIGRRAWDAVVQKIGRDLDFESGWFLPRHRNSG